MPVVAEELGTDPDVVDRLSREFQKHLHVLHGSGEDPRTSPRCGTTIEEVRLSERELVD